MQYSPSMQIVQIKTKNILFHDDAIPAEHATTLASRIWFVNKDRRVNTSQAKELHAKSVKPPPGLAVFEPITWDGSLNQVIADLNRLFHYHHKNPHAIEFTTRGPGIKALFTFRNTEDVGPNYHRIWSALHTHQPHLTRFIQQHIAALVKPELLSTVNIELMQYQPNSAFKSHIDNVVQTNDEPWPVYAIHIGKKTKRFDLLPVFAKQEPAVRVLVEPGQTVLLDGHARLDYSHSVPSAKELAYTIRFHFKHGVHEQVGYNSVLKIPVCMSQTCQT
jgi:hypothetical protein